MKQKPRLLEILERLISYPTVTGNALAAYDCLKYAEEIIEEAGLAQHVRKYHSGGFGSMVVTTKGTKKPKVLLQAHLDVVPGSEEMFAVRRENGRLLGRGVFDMKYAAACYLLLVEELREELHELDFGIMFTTDEEGSGLNGVKHLLEVGYGCEICILPDGGDNWNIESKAKGGWAVKAVALGITAHGSRPWEGENAIDKLLGFIKDAKKLVPLQDHSGTTMVVSQIVGGQTHNQVPNDAWATIDIRYFENRTGDKIRERLMKLAASRQISLESVTDIRPVLLDTALPAIKAWQRIACEVRGVEDIGFTTSYGASDARFFAEKGIPTLLTRPDGGGHHGEQEWLDESGLYDFYECMKQYVRLMASEGVATGKEKRYTTSKLPETVTELPS